MAWTRLATDPVEPATAPYLDRDLSSSLPGRS
jgi:hypothetical protein